MIKVTQCIAIALVAAASVSAHAGATDSSTLWVTPTIHDYGKIRLIPDAAFKPQPGRTYKVVFSLTQAAKQTGEVNPALDRVARTVNLYVASGVPLRDLKFVRKPTALRHLSPSTTLTIAQPMESPTRICL